MKNRNGSSETILFTPATGFALQGRGNIASIRRLLTDFKDWHVFVPFCHSFYFWILGDCYVYSGLWSDGTPRQFWRDFLDDDCRRLLQFAGEMGLRGEYAAACAGRGVAAGGDIDAWLGWLGFNSHSLDYVYQGATVAGAITLYHWLFSFAFAFVYVFCSVFWPRIRMWYGVLYGLIITVVMHGFLIPLLGFRNPVYAEGKVGWLWNLNGYELWSEILGHIYWSVSIEVCMIAVLAHYARPIRGDWVMR